MSPLRWDCGAGQLLLVLRQGVAGGDVTRREWAWAGVALVVASGVASCLGLIVVSTWLVW